MQPQVKWSTARRRYLKAFFRSVPNVLGQRLFKRKPHYDRIGNIKDITLEKSDDRIKSLLISGEPCAIIRYGGTEMSALNNYEKIRLGFARKFRPINRELMKTKAGFFPATDEQLKHYGAYLERHLFDLDTLAITGLHMEAYFHQQFSPAAVPIQNWALDPLIGTWSHLLKGKKVLVISPFADDIRKQYEKRELLFPKDKNILPEFTLLTLKAVQTIGDADDQRFATWFEALDYMKMEILRLDFDVALIGAGSYGTPLALFVKTLGKQGLQTGGATQLLFGIIGKRWENREPVKSYVNEHWIRPSSIPAGHQKIEKGCYW